MYSALLLAYSSEVFSFRVIASSLVWVMVGLTFMFLSVGFCFGGWILLPPVIKKQLT